MPMPKFLPFKKIISTISNIFKSVIHCNISDAMTSLLQYIIYFS